MLASVFVASCCALAGSGEGGKSETFSAHYQTFGVLTYYAVTTEDLEKDRQAYDVSSCLKPYSAELKNIISRKGSPAKFSEGQARLLVSFGSDRWAVDNAGVVRHDGHDSALSDDDFNSLLYFFLYRLPLNGPPIFESIKMRSSNPLKPRPKSDSNADR